jgi:protein tyrosine/serine phosphatase
MLYELNLAKMAKRPHSATRRPLFSRLAFGRIASVIVLFATTLLMVPAIQARGLPVQEGILNFGKVSERLYRGAQPGAEGIQNLKRLGVKLIVNLRMPGEAWKDEAALAQASGIQYTNFPMSGAGRPNEQQIRQILALFESADTPVFVHCLHGCDRTGTVVACYRIFHDRWSTVLALREAKTYGISWLEFRMKSFVVSFGRPVTPDVRQARAG